MHISTRILFTLFLLLRATYFLHAVNQPKIDSLEKVAQSAIDTIKISALLQLSEEYQRLGNPEKSKESAKHAQRIAEKMQFKDGIARSFNRQGHLLSEGSSFEEAIGDYKRAMKLAEETKNLPLQADCLTAIGSICRRMGKYGEGLTILFKALKLYEKLGLENEEKCMMGIGVIYSKQKNYTTALKYLFAALKTSENNGNIRMKSRILVNIGVVYYSLKNYEKSIAYYKRVLESAEKLNDLAMQQASYSNIGGMYIILQQYEKGYEYCSKALAIAKLQEDKENMVITTGNIGEACAGMKKYDLAEKYYLEALRMSKVVGIKDITQEIYLMLSEFYEKKGDYKNTHIYFKLYSALKDTLLNKENSKLVTEMDARYQTEKKQKQIELQQSALSKQTTELNQQRMVIFGALGGVCLLLLLAFLLYNRYQLKQKANNKLQTAYGQIEEKNREIEKRNLQITDSIDYAKRIQEAILPDQEEIQQLFPESFIFFRPLDIVSGDFYWYSAENDRVILVVADCTGHGVPGAFMSMIGNTLLNEIVNQKKITDPGTILKWLNEGVIDALHQNKETNAKQHDGMEMGICSIDLGNKELTFAGSRHNLYLFGTDNQLIEIKGDRTHIGGIKDNEPKKFTTHVLSIKDGVTLYLCTDGFMDQSGGSANKRLTSRKFKELLIRMQEIPVPAQKELMEDEFEQWKGTQKQKDDVLVMGIKC
jgi:serine phosphatase RsbU (regulator of sigma subunit)/tetratricopeptide (TPR) repeat protein